METLKDGTAFAGDGEGGSYVGKTDVGGQRLRGQPSRMLGCYERLRRATVGH